LKSIGSYPRRCLIFTIMVLDLDRCIESIKKCQILTENQMRQLCRMVSILLFITLSLIFLLKSIDILIEEPNIINVSAPIAVCGDIHGQFYDLLELFSINGEITSTRYMFLGDYVDRGHHSLECFTLLLLLKAK
jgi:hypothetical protein